MSNSVTGGVQTRVTTLNRIPEGWDKLVRDCAWGAFYHSSLNLKLLEGASPAKVNFIGCYEDDRLAGGLAYGIQKGPLGPIVNCLPYFGSYGDAVISPLAPEGTDKSIYQALIEQCRKMDALCLTVITSPFAESIHHKNVKDILAPDFIDERCCQIAAMPACSGEDKSAYAAKIMQMMEGRNRTLYRKALKNNFEIRSARSEEESAEFFRIHKASIGKKSGIFKTEKFFKEAFALSRSNPGTVEMVIALDKGRIVSGVVLFYFNSIVEYHTTCLSDEYRSSGSLSRIVIEKMIDAGMRGYRYWNFGGTWKSQESLYRFKQSFGAFERNYFYYTIFFRDLDRVKSLSRQEIIDSYPLCYVIPFSEIAE